MKVINIAEINSLNGMEGIEIQTFKIQNYDSLVRYDPSSNPSTSPSTNIGIKTTMCKTSYPAKNYISARNINYTNEHKSEKYYGSCVCVEGSNMPKSVKPPYERGKHDCLK